MSRRCSSVCSPKTERRPEYERLLSVGRRLVKDRWTLSIEWIKPIWDGDQMTELYSRRGRT